jgi:hypothetical protein
LDSSLLLTSFSFLLVIRLATTVHSLPDVIFDVPREVVRVGAQILVGVKIVYMDENDASAMIDASDVIIVPDSNSLQSESAQRRTNKVKRASGASVSAHTTLNVPSKAGYIFLMSEIESIFIDGFVQGLPRSSDSKCRPKRLNFFYFIWGNLSLIFIMVCHHM